MLQSRVLQVTQLEDRCTPASGLAATYWDNDNFTGASVSRVDPTPYFDWGLGSPAAAIQPDTFSARWTGQIQTVEAGTYQFRSFTDDGIRVWVNNALIINDWNAHAAAYNLGSINLAANTKYDIKVEYFEGGGAAVMQLLWARPTDTTYNTIPTANLFTPPGNTAPTVSNVTNRVLTVNQNTGPIAFTIGDAQTPAAGLTVSAASSSTALVPTANVTFGGSGANRTVTVTPAAGQTGTTTITLTVTDAGGLTATDTFAVTVVPAPVVSGDVVISPAYIASPGDRYIPNFGAAPTITALASGNWSNPDTWGGAAVPGTDAVVSIPNGVTVTVDGPIATTLKTVVVQSGGTLRFATGVNTSLRVVNLIVHEAGALEMGTTASPVAAGVTAEVIFPDRAINTATDPSQYGNGLIAFGKVTVCGANRANTFIRLTQEPLQGQSQLQLSAPATGWRVGDTILIPDSHQMEYFETPSAYRSQAETATISAISTDQKTITFNAVKSISAAGAQVTNAALQYNHWGARAPGVAGTAPAEVYPHVVLLSRNARFRSENPAGTRGHTFFSHRAEVDVRYAEFADLGRTNMNDLNSTQRDTNGTVLSVGTNQQGRYAVHLHHLYGKAPAVAGGTSPNQFRFVGNSVASLNNGADNLNRWAVALHDTSYGTLSDNVLYNAGGVGFALEDGSEIGNVFQNNYVSRITGYGNRDNPGRQGLGFWVRNPKNTLTGNVANAVRTVGGANAYGFNIAPRTGGNDESDTAAFLYSLGTVGVPAYAGANPWAAGTQLTQINANAQTITRFEGNEVYGATPFALSVWDIGVDNTTSDPSTPAAQLGTAGVLKNTTAWHIHTQAYFGYPTNNLTIDGFKLRSDTLHGLDPIGNMPAGLDFSDYNQRGLVIQNADIQGANVGIKAPPFSYGAVVIQNSTLRNKYNIVVTNPWSVGGPTNLPAKSLTVNAVNFQSLGLGGVQTTHLNMAFQYREGYNLMSADSTLVTNSTFNGTLRQNFRAYYRTQAASYRVPPTGSAFQLFDTGGNLLYDGVDLAGTATTRLDAGGSPLIWGGRPVVGAPTVYTSSVSQWPTNAQLWAQSGTAIAGEVAPTTAVTAAGINGLVNYV